MKDITVVLCCSGLMVNNRFIFITVQYAHGYVCACVCVCPSRPTQAVIMDIWNSVPASRLSRGITHLPLILCSLVVLGFAADLMRGEGFVVVNFSIHPKEEERCSSEKEWKKTVATLSCFTQWKGMTTNTWGHFLISSLSTQTGQIIHRELYSVGKSHPPMGISLFLKTLRCSSSYCDSVTFIIQCLWKNGSSLCRRLRLSFISWFQSMAEVFLA